jgi:outer membrane protein TolC
MKQSLILVLLLPTAVLSAEPVEVARSATLDQLVDTALAQNPQLKSNRARWEAMRERPTQATALPNPMFTYSGMNAVSGGNWPATNEKRFGVEQSFPWFGKLGLKGKVAAKDAEASGHEYETMARELVMMVKETYFDLYAVQQSRQWTRSAVNVLSNMLKSAEAMYSTGARSQEDVIKAQTEITMLQQRLLEYDQQEYTLNAKIHQLLNQPDVTFTIIAVSPPPTTPPPTLQQLVAFAAASRPEIRRADAEIQRDQATSKLMRKEVFPDYKLGVEYRSLNNDDDMVMFTIGIELPIWRNKYKAAAREADKMLDASRAARQSAEQQTIFDVRDAYFKLQTAQRTATLYRDTLIPQAKLRYQASESSYRTGKSDFLDLLESERFLLETRVMSAMAEATIGIQLARLERAVGTDLQSIKE